MQRILKITLLLFLSLVSVSKTEAEDVKHRLIAQDKGKVVILSSEGKVEWEFQNNYVAHDIVALPNGNVVVATAHNKLVEVTPEKKIIWEWTSKPVGNYKGVVEIHGFQRLSNGNTMIPETGNRRIIEVNRKGEVVKEIPLTIDNPDSHRDVRMARKLKNGNYLVCHEGDRTVREYDKNGKVVWQYFVDMDGKPETSGHEGHGNHVFGAIQLRNGNKLIACGNGNRVVEVNKKGQVVWSVGYHELPGIEFHWVTTLQELPNGNIVIGNTHAGPENPQLVEVTHDSKKMVMWLLKNWDVFGNDLCASQILDIKGLNR